jgi:cell division septal protein FtsQ
LAREEAAIGSSQIEREVLASSQSKSSRFDRRGVRTGISMPDNRAEEGIQVMEHREPPRFAAGDRRSGEIVEDPDQIFRLRAFNPAGVGPRREWRRAGLLAFVGLALAVGFIYLARQAAQAAVAWLHHQPQYLVPFGEIHLVTNPPACYRGGSVAFLEHVRRTAGEPKQISLLEQTPDRLARAFRLDPWVEKVVRVAYGPSRISVALEYREPVAWVKLPRGQQQVVDGEGRILPSEDVDVEPLAHRIKITGEDLADPADLRPGLVWKRKGRDGGMDEVDARVVAAARLARFLQNEDRVRKAQASRALQILEIIVSNLSDFSRGGLFVMNAEGAEIRWGDAPGAESPGKPTADEKWRILADWREPIGSRSLAVGDYWEFSRKGLHKVCPHEPSSHRPHREKG